MMSCRKIQWWQATIDIPDTYISPVDARGIGEIGNTGITAAIANAIYHATGIRVRELPITPDKLLGDAMA